MNFISNLSYNQRKKTEDEQEKKEKAKLARKTLIFMTDTRSVPLEDNDKAFRGTNPPIVQKSLMLAKVLAKDHRELGSISIVPLKFG
jgi:hypothetical protein